MKSSDLKELVGKKAAQLVKEGMTVGLGTGSTVEFLISELGTRIRKERLRFKGIATSQKTENLAQEAGIPLVNLDETEKIDLAVDGADEVDRELNLVKGGGGALTREKIIDYRAKKFVVIVDEGKLVDILGRFPIPVEVLPFGVGLAKQELEQIGAKVKVRKVGKENFVTDNSSYILDAKFDLILKPKEVERMINNIPGVIENGIFRKEKISEVWVGTEKGIKVKKNK